MNIKVSILLVLIFHSLVSKSQTPAGDNFQIQFNDNGSFGASPYLRWDGSLLRLEDMGDNSARIYLRSETGDQSYIFSENYGTNSNRLVFQTGISEEATLQQPQYRVIE
ncbi:MAG: hypothetical protein AAFY41_12240 [Bacteroidota bacterium]